MNNNNRCIGIVGCGNMGSALAHRLYLCGFNVVMGSRALNRQHNTQMQVVSIIECIHHSDIIFIALHPEHYSTSLVSLLDLERSLFDGKILVDLSNQSCRKSHMSDFSNAERLQTMIPNAFVVKAFNTVSSFLMQNTTAGESRHIFVASDHPIAREKVITLAREMNFDPFNAGSLRAARHLEKSSQLLFPQWRMPIVVTFLVLFVWLLYTLYAEFISAQPSSWHQLFLNVVNKTLCPSAITMLAVVYMPSNLACIFQLVYGTRDRQFPNWLDRWLLARKQLGILAFPITVCHSVMSIILMKPAYYATWFDPLEIMVLPAQNTTQSIVQGGLMTAKGELASLLGILTQLSMSILAITSIPAIGNLLNWREWRFIQSKIGTITLLLAIGHVAAMATPRWIELGIIKSLYNLALLCLYFPIITILLKFIFWLPCFSRPLHRIRRGQNTSKTRRITKIQEQEFVCHF